MHILKHNFGFHWPSLKENDRNVSAGYDVCVHETKCSESGYKLLMGIGLKDIFLL